MTFSYVHTHVGNKVEKLDPKLTTLNLQFRGRLFNSNNKASFAFSIRVPIIDPIQNRITFLFTIHHFELTTSVTRLRFLTTKLKDVSSKMETK